jgi:hypothetical protein
MTQRQDDPTLSCDKTDTVVNRMSYANSTFLHSIGKDSFFPKEEQYALKNLLVFNILFMNKIWHRTTICYQHITRQIIFHWRVWNEYTNSSTQSRSNIIISNFRSTHFPLQQQWPRLHSLMFTIPTLCSEDLQFNKYLIWSLLWILAILHPSSEFHSTGLISQLNTKQKDIITSHMHSHV